MFWKKFSRKECEKSLEQLFSIKNFYDSQWKVIKKLFKKKRLLMIERTGFGKSLCYQFPATQLSGLTIVFTPLISLMRDQVNQLNKLNIPSNLLHGGQTFEEKDEILFSAMSGRIKLLYISPERQENEQWLDAIKLMEIGMVVVDEAHCISEWGHDFRPTYQKIVHTVKNLPNRFPILATTATATSLVIKDIRYQIGRASITRGSLNRPNFHLSVVRVQDDHSKYYYIKKLLSTLPGQGLIYCGTRADTQCYAAFLCGTGITTVAYHGGLSNNKRDEIEKGLMGNSYKVVCSTNALGMGLNKKDIRFVIHTQFPQNLSQYYQEIGRAGRDDKPSYIILLYNPKDDTMFKRHIQKGYPSKEDYLSVLNLLKSGDKDLTTLLLETELSTTILKIILAKLEKKKWIELSIRSGEMNYHLIRKHFLKKVSVSDHQMLKKIRFEELSKIHKYCQSYSCRMSHLREHFSERTNESCGQCDNCRKEKLYFVPEEEDIKLVKEFWDSFHPELIIISENDQKIPLEKRANRIVNGVACSYYGKTEIGMLIRKAKYKNGSQFHKILLERTVHAFHNYFQNQKFDLLLYVPPTSSGDLVRDFATELSVQLNIPIHHTLTKQKEHSAQKNSKNLFVKAKNIKNSFHLKPIDLIKGKQILLVDDICDSGETIKEIGRYLSLCGAKKIAPLVIAKTVGTDE